MAGKRLLFLLCLFGLLVGRIPVLGQEADQPLVVFVLNPDIDSGSPFDAGPNGLSSLNNIFQSLGARTQVVNLIEAVPLNAKVIVLVGPRKRLSIIALARLWIGLGRGQHLLLALDPSGYGPTETENFRSGLVGFVDNAYGIMIQDALMAETWFTKQTVLGLSGTFFRTHADVVQHPVVAPLRQYDVPVYAWAARPIRVEPLGLYSKAVPLLQTTTAYGETNAEVLLFNGDEPPLERNIETDITGLVNIAGLGENTRTGSRVAVLGDSEMLRNGYGLATESGSLSPRYVGNYLFAERLSAWLLELDAAQWPGLPQGFAWIAFDGDAADWDPAIPIVNDGLDSASLDFNLRTARAVQDDSYLYVLAQTVGAPNPAAQVDMTFADDETGAPVMISAAPGQVTLTVGEGDPVDISDGSVIVGDSIEIRLPVRVLGGADQIDRFCLSAGADAGEPDCLEAVVPISVENAKDPSGLHFPEGPLVIVTSVRNVVLRSLPDSGSLEVTALEGGSVMRAVGRTEASDWIQVESGDYAGWIFSSLIAANFDVNALPVTDGAPAAS
ncbi:MAG: hypothetical protein K8L99_16550 [Anaerolineae bacterium]|nr:hypothetical protein [Anaerolineae bacterium]